jgi:glyoxylase I family protein
VRATTYEVRERAAFGLARAPGWDYALSVRPFHHLAIQCADLAACERFYRDVLGLPVLRRWARDEGGDRSVWLALGEGDAPPFLALERAAAPAEPRPFVHGGAGLHLLALAIPAAERGAWEARLAAAGVPIVHRTGFTLYVQDPEGNRIGLSHHPDAP